VTLKSPLWSSGFRPFFLLGAAYGPLAVALWMLVPLPPIWHAHEMVYGFAAAIVCGVLLTALPSWTGAAELRGAPLAALSALWLAGRLAMLAGNALPSIVVAALDCALLPVLCVLLAPVLGAGRRRLFLWTLPPLVALAAGNVLFHAADSGAGAAWAVRLGLHALAFLFSLYGGLLAPAFTRNYLRARGEQAAAIHVPLEYATAGAMVLFAAADLAPAEPAWIVASALLALGVQGVRALRWRGWRTAGEPLLWTLHLGYAWFLAMFVLRALAEVTPAVPRDAWTHAFTLGALGLVMTGLMTRVVLRHTGRPLVVAAAMQAAYWLVLAAAVLRLAYTVHGLGERVLAASALAWSAAFLIYVVRYGAMLVRPSLPRLMNPATA
jgi:uncharacterized protein involved in response to NO